jgi:YVTN family beta-propeller protein
MAGKFLAIPLTIMLLAGYGCTSPDDRAMRSGPDARSQASLASANPVLLADRTGTLSAIDPASDEVSFRTRSSEVSPSGTLVYQHRRHSITITDLATLRRVGRTSVPAGMELQVASASGRLLALAEPNEPGTNPWIPAGRARTKITVVPTNQDSPRRTYDLKGNFGVEAFSTDDRQLFLIEFMPANHPWHYGLRRLVLETGKIREIARSNQNAPGQMNGTGRLSIFSPLGHELYTLYTQQGPNYTHTEPVDARPDEVYAFIHLLNLEGAWTHCIDLPAPFGTGRVTSHAMAISDDGTRLFVADPSSGGLAVIDPRTARVLRTVTVNLRALRDGVSAAVATDGTLYLAGGTRIMAFDGGSLRPLREFRVVRTISGIATSRDASKLYVAFERGIEVLDSETGRRDKAIRTASAGTPNAQ